MAKGVLEEPSGLLRRVRNGHRRDGLLRRRQERRADGTLDARQQPGGLRLRPHEEHRLRRFKRQGDALRRLPRRLRRALHRIPDLGHGRRREVRLRDKVAAVREILVRDEEDAVAVLLVRVEREHPSVTRRNVQLAHGEWTRLAQAFSAPVSPRYGS